MCPACVASAAVMAAGVGSTGEFWRCASAKSEKCSAQIVPVCFRKHLLQKTKEK
jgi:hypothetical protein